LYQTILPVFKVDQRDEGGLAGGGEADPEHAMPTIAALRPPLEKAPRLKVNSA